MPFGGKADIFAAGRPGAFPIRTEMEHEDRHGDSVQHEGLRPGPEPGRAPHEAAGPLTASRGGLRALPRALLWRPDPCGPERKGEIGSMERTRAVLADVQGVYSGPEGDLWKLIMGEQIHIGGFQQSMILAGKAGIAKGEKVLDLCSALGAGLRFLARFHGAKGYGLDATEAMLSKARAATAADGLSDSIEYRLGDVRSIPWPDGFFDVVWGEDAWCYVEDKESMIREAGRVLRPGGRVAFSDWVEGPAGWTESTAQRICSFMKFPYIGPRSYWEGLLLKAGFEIISSEDCTPHFAKCIDLYITMLTEQLTFDALRIIGWDMDMFKALGGEMAFMSEQAHAGSFGRCRIVALRK